MKKTYTNKPYGISTALKANFPYDGVADYEKDKNVDRFIFLKGQPIQEKIPQLQFEVGWVAKVGLELDFWDNNSGSLLAGPNGIQFLQEFCFEDVQFFDARIRCKDQEVASYKLVNLTHMVNAIDEDKSQGNYLEGDYTKGEKLLYGFEKFVFNENCMNSHHIARDSKLRSWIVCSPEFVKEYKKRKLKGLKFVEDDAYLLGQESFRKD